MIVQPVVEPMEHSTALVQVVQVEELQLGQVALRGEGGGQAELGQGGRVLLVPGLPDLRRAPPPPDGAAQRAQAAAGLPSGAHVAVVERGVAQQLLQHAVGEVLYRGHGHVWK